MVAVFSVSSPGSRARSISRIRVSMPCRWKPSGGSTTNVVADVERSGGQCRRAARVRQDHRTPSGGPVGVGVGLQHVRVGDVVTSIGFQQGPAADE